MYKVDSLLTYMTLECILIIDVFLLYHIASAVFCCLLSLHVCMLFDSDTNLFHIQLFNNTYLICETYMNVSMYVCIQHEQLYVLCQRHSYTYVRLKRLTYLAFSITITSHQYTFQKPGLLRLSTTVLSIRSLLHSSLHMVIHTSFTINLKKLTKASYKKSIASQ
jgi:hypothetical protein